MKLFTGKSLEDIKQIRLIDVIFEQLEEELSKNVNIKIDDSGDGSSWIELDSEDEKILKTVVLSFIDEGSKLTDIAYFETLIKKLIDEDNIKRKFHS